jgi:hypothetical protein
VPNESELPTRPDERFVETFLPTASACPEARLCVPTDPSVEFPHELGDRLAFARADKRVPVVRHHDECGEINVSIAPVAKQRVNHNSAMPRRQDSSTGKQTLGHEPTAMPLFTAVPPKIT